MAENDKKANLLQAQGPKNPPRNQPITIEEYVLQEQPRHPKKKTKVQPIVQKDVESEKNPCIGSQGVSAAEKSSQIGNPRAAGAEKYSQIGNTRVAETEKNSQIGNRRAAGAGKYSQIGNPRAAETEKNSQIGNRRASEAKKNSHVGNKRADEAVEAVMNQRTVEARESENSSEDEEEDAIEQGTDKKGMSLDMYFKVHGINLDDEDDEEDEENEEDQRDEDLGTTKKKTRGKTTCKKLHTSEFKDRQEVEFYQEQPIGPTMEVVSNLRNFVGTFVGNPTFVTLLYTSWHGVSDKLKEDMWEYINEKFILSIESKQWVMQALCRAWKKYKAQIKLLHFTKYKTKKQMMRNRPLHTPEVQFRKLIRYWRLPEIKAISEKNIENWSKQTCPHRMGSTSFAIVRKQLRDSKENNEEPSRAEIFTVTRSSKKGKEIDPKSQSTIDELKTRIEAGENHEDAFVQVLGKDQPGRLRCYGASITKSSLKKHEEIRQVRVECKDLVSSLQQQMEGVCGLLKVMMQQINPEMSEEDIAALVQAVRNSPSDASSSRPRVNTPRSSESTHFPPNGDGSGGNGAHK